MLKHLYVTKIDAKQELDNINCGGDIDRFNRMFFVARKDHLDELLDGEKYFVTGDKGTGKTAFLIYAALQAEALFTAERCFIIFQELSQEEREEYRGLAHITKYDKDDLSPHIDYEYVWWWVFHNTIADTILSSEKEIFVHNEALDTYLAAVHAIKTSPRSSGRKIPLITTGGYVDASVSVPLRGATINLSGKINFERSSDNPQQVRFSTYINELNRLYSNLDEGESPLYMVVDEMNLSRINSAEYERDIFLIRDLIIAIEKFNLISKNCHDSVRIMGAIRKEVINTVSIKGKEINKAIESYGIPIDWTLFVESGLKHPLIKLLINYFRISDSQQNLSPYSDDDKEFFRWVDPKIWGRSSEEVLRSYTLYRPRNIVRLLKLVKDHRGSDDRITSDTMESIKRNYSTDCWNEVLEELALLYTPIELQLIREWLTGMPWKTTYESMLTDAQILWNKNINAQKLIANFDELMQHLFRVGVIGNIRHTPVAIEERWHFLGDEILIRRQDIIIHEIFRPVLSSVSPV